MRRVCRIDLRSDIDLVHDPGDIERFRVIFTYEPFRAQGLGWLPLP